MVTAVVCAAFDVETDAQVLAERRRLVALGMRLPAEPRHRPHLTLFATRVEPDALTPVGDLAAGLAARHDTFPVPLDDVGRFDGGVVWLGPRRVPDVLAALQRDAVETMAADGRASAFGEQSAPANWVAHCTLATRVPRARLRAIQRELAAGFEPIAATVTGIAVIVVGGSGDAAWAPLRSAQ